ncbi:hypothetical protein [Bacteroides thetaiotaomicron]|uniref:hypothetical protein n=1 Tax=Bacteroides thetaiotaomicron TaxID=818 RepID=UPI00356A653F
MIRGRSCQVNDSSPTDRGQKYGSDQASIFRLTTHRSAIASRRSLTGLHPHAPALLRRCFYRKQAFTCSVYRKTLCFARRAASLVFPVAT